MKLVHPRILLALAFGIALTGLARANEELRFTEIEQRLAMIEERLASQTGVQAASYYNGEAIDDYDCAPEDCYPGCDECTCSYGRFYTEVELYWARLHLSESVTGKLSESHEVSPRFILGYEAASGIGARVRYWNYSRGTRVIGTGDDIRFELDVTDIEGTNHLYFNTTDVTLAGGLRLADIEAVDLDNRVADIHMCGLTVAADLRTRFPRVLKNRVAAVYGGRISVLGGDWDGSSQHAFIDRSRDNNLVVHELYSGLEYHRDFGGRNFFSRVVWEMQTWQTDSLERADSFGFVGPALHLGASY